VAERAPKGRLVKVLGVVLLLLVVVVVVTGLTALLLALASLLAHIFAVSVWQASLVLLGVSGGVGWVVWTLGTPGPWDL
jgi:heme A synthase